MYVRRKVEGSRGRVSPKQPVLEKGESTEAEGKGSVLRPEMY